MWLVSYVNPSLNASMSQVFICLNLNSKFHILICRWRNAYLTRSILLKMIRSVKLRTSAFCYLGQVGRLRVSNDFFAITDLSATLNDHNINRCDPNTSLFDRFCSHCILQSVRYDSFFPFFLPAHSGRYHRSPSALENSPRAVSVLDRACSTVAPMPLAVPLNHMEVAVHKTYRRYRDSDEMGGPASNSMANLCSAEGRALALVRPTHDRVLELRPVSAPQPTFGHS